MMEVQPALFQAMMTYPWRNGLPEHFGALFIMLQGWRVGGSPAWKTDTQRKVTPSSHQRWTGAESLSGEALWAPQDLQEQSAELFPPTSQALTRMSRAEALSCKHRFNVKDCPSNLLTSCFPLPPSRAFITVRKEVIRRKEDVVKSVAALWYSTSY